jgi:hypothetical protein
MKEKLITQLQEMISKLLETMEGNSDLKTITVRNEMYVGIIWKEQAMTVEQLSDYLKQALKKCEGGEV